MGADDLKLHVDDSEVDELVEKLKTAREEAEKLVIALKQAKKLQETND